MHDNSAEEPWNGLSKVRDNGDRTTCAPFRLHNPVSSEETPCLVSSLSLIETTTLGADPTNRLGSAIPEPPAEPLPAPPPPNCVPSDAMNRMDEVELALPKEIEPLGFPLHTIDARWRPVESKVVPPTVCTAFVTNLAQDNFIANGDEVHGTLPSDPGKAPTRERGFLPIQAKGTQAVLAREKELLSRQNNGTQAVPPRVPSTHDATSYPSREEVGINTPFDPTAMQRTLDQVALQMDHAEMKLQRISDANPRLHDDPLAPVVAEAHSRVALDGDPGGPSPSLAIPSLKVHPPPPLYMDEEALAHVDRIDQLYFATTQDGTKVNAMEFIRAHFTATTLYALETQRATTSASLHTVTGYLSLSQALRSLFTSRGVPLKDVFWDFPSTNIYASSEGGLRPTLHDIHTHLRDRERRGHLREDLQKAFAYQRYPPDLRQCMGSLGKGVLGNMSWAAFRTRSEHCVRHLIEMRSSNLETWQRSANGVASPWLDIVRTTLGPPRLRDPHDVPPRAEL